MPRYDYRCPSCNTVFEVEHGMREHPEVLCPDCGTPAIRQFKTSSIVFKGSGFYNTDQRDKKGSTKATAGKPAAETETAAPASTDATASEQTPASDTSTPANTSAASSESSASTSGSASASASAPTTSGESESE